MKFYIIAIECFFLTIASFSFLTGTRFRPPEKWGEAPYYRTKLAKKIYVKIDKTVFKGMRFDLFHLACFHFYFLCLIISAICSVIDLLTFFALTKLFGTSLLLILFIILALLLFLYEFALCAWSDVLDRQSQCRKESRKETETLKRLGVLKEITKKRKKKK